MIQNLFQISTLIETACNFLIPCSLNPAIFTQIKMHFSEDYKAKLICLPASTLSFFPPCLLEYLSFSHRMLKALMQIFPLSLLLGLLNISKLLFVK